MLLGYFDDSGTHNTSAVVAIAGYVAPADAWRSFEAEWRELLTAKRLIEFRMASCEAGWGSFKGWSREARELLPFDFAALIARSRLRGFSFAVRKFPYRTILLPTLDPPEKRLFRNPALFCMQGCMNGITKDQDHGFLPREKVRMVFERGDKPVERRLREHFLWLKENRGWKDVFESIDFESKGESIALQAADMLAYETYRDGVNAEPRRPRRPLMDYLIRDELVHFGYHDQFSLTDLVAALKRLGSEP